MVGPLRRRGVLEGLGMAAIGITLGGLGGCKKHFDKNVNLYTWDTYIGKHTVSGFEDRTGTGLKVSLFANNDELFAKMRAGNPGYDVIVPTHDFVPRMAKAGMLQPLDHAKIPNMKNIAPKWQAAPFDPGRKYSVPYTWLVLGIGYRKSKVDGVPDSWKWVMDSDRYKGRIGLLGDAVEMCRLVECYMGKDITKFDPAVLAKVQQLLIKQKPNVTAFHDDNGQDLLLSGDVDLVIEYNGDIAQVMREDKDLAFVVPKEGSVISSDQLCIPKGAPNPEGAHALINYLLDADVSADIFSAIRFPTPNGATLAKMPADYRDNPAIFPPDSALAKCQFGSYLGEDAYRAFSDVMTRVRAD